MAKLRLRRRLQLAGLRGYMHMMGAWEKLRYGVSFHPFTAVDDPYTVHSRMRETNPCFYSPMWRGWWVSSFEGVQDVLRDKRFGADVRKYPARAKRIRRSMDSRTLELFDNPSMLDLDPPDHTRIRRLAQQGFVHRFIQSLEPRIRGIVRECLEVHNNEAVTDFVEALAKPLPAIVIAEMLGLPREDHERFRIWSEDLMLGAGTADADNLVRAREARNALIDYFEEMVAYKTENPGEDLMSRLIDAEEEGAHLEGLQLYNTCLLLLIAGHETTTRLISNGLYLLMQHPDQCAQLRENPSLIPQAVEEMLRFEPPVQATRRFVTEDLDFHGNAFKQGEVVFVSIPGANRDPGANDTPDTFDINREDCQQVSFGYGIHLCIGASLARLEAKVAFEEILVRYDNLQLVETPEWGNNPFFRGVESLSLSLK